MEADSGDLSDDNQMGIFSTLEESVYFVLQQWQVDDTNDSVQILSIYLRGEDCIFLSYLLFCPENFTPLGPDQSLGMTSDFVFIDNDTIFDWATIQK